MASAFAQLPDVRTTILSMFDLRTRKSRNSKWVYNLNGDDQTPSSLETPSTTASFDSPPAPTDRPPRFVYDLTDGANPGQGTFKRVFARLTEILSPPLPPVSTTIRRGLVRPSSKRLASPRPLYKATPDPISTPESAELLALKSQLRDVAAGVPSPRPAASAAPLGSPSLSSPPLPPIAYQEFRPVRRVHSPIPATRTAGTDLPRQSVSLLSDEALGSCGVEDSILVPATPEHDEASMSLHVANPAHYTARGSLASSPIYDAHAEFAEHVLASNFAEPCLGRESFGSPVPAVEATNACPAEYISDFDEVEEDEDLSSGGSSDGSESFGDEDNAEESSDSDDDSAVHPPKRRRTTFQAPRLTTKPNMLVLRNKETGTTEEFVLVRDSDVFEFEFASVRDDEFARPPEGDASFDNDLQTAPGQITATQESILANVRLTVELLSKCQLQDESKQSRVTAVRARMKWAPCFEE